MQHTQQHSNPRDHAGNHSVLDDGRYVTGLPSDTKSPVEQARYDKRPPQACKSVLDGPQCIDGC